MFMAWSDYAYEHGPTRAYDMPRGHPVWVARGAGKVEAVSVPLQCNYPPLSTLVFWLQGFLWHQLDDQVATGHVTRRGARGQPETLPVRSRIINTTVSRFVNALAGILADLVLAWGVLHLVRGLLPRASPTLEIAGFALTALAPPIVIDSAFWSQSDSWVTAVVVWVVVCALRRRFWIAGGLYGAALMLKAQALIFAPVLAFACAAHALRPGGSPRDAWPAFRAGSIGALLVIASSALPFSLGKDSTSWVERAYVQPVLEQYPYTTTKAFNLWWLEGAAREQPGALRDSRARVGGLTKDTIGRGLLALGVLISVVAATRRFGVDPAATVAIASLVSLAAFVLPTRVKARYIYYCLPFLIAMALRFRPWRVALGGLLILATAELTWNLWYDIGSPGAQALSVGLASLSVLVLVYSWAALLVGKPRDVSSRAGDHSM